MPICTKKKAIRFLKDRVPILKWGPKYTTHKLVCDVIAGITVALTVMPQALAYATLAGLEPQYGLYSAFIGCFIYAIFGTCKEVAIGPTALMALMTYQQIANRNTDYAVLLCFLSGIVQLIMAVLNLGVLIDFISIPVTVGFTSATSVIIAASQIKSLLGLQFTASDFLDTITKVCKNIHNTRLADTVLGFVCIFILISLRKIKEIKLTKDGDKPTNSQKYLSKMLWLVSTSRNAIVVITCSCIAYFMESSGKPSPFIVTGDVKPGLPDFKAPPFGTELNNKTVTATEMMADFGAAIVLVPVIAVLGNVAIAKAFASGKAIDATQELLTLSLCNIFGSFFSSMPITGSFSRSAVNHASGVQTPFGGVFTGVLVLLALSFLTPYFAYIPKASLAAVIICAVIYMIEYEVVKPMWRSSRKDLIPTFATFILCLVIGVELGIVIGVAINLVFLLYPSARPHIFVETQKSISGFEYILVTPGNSLYFPAIEFIKTSVGKAGLSSSHLPVVVDCRFILGADFTAAKGISALINEFVHRKQPLYFYNLREEVIQVFKGAVLEDIDYLRSPEELDQVLKEDYRLRDENAKLLDPVEDLGLEDIPKSSSITELKEITCSGSTSNNITHRRSPEDN